jgi:hypothetical protein
MPGIVIHENKVVYWYIPKNACTSLKTYFAKLLGLEYEIVHDAPFELINDFNSLPDYFHFSIVRHPFVRLYSLYKNKILSEPIDSDFFERGVEKIVFKYWMDRFWAGMTFNDFCKSVSSIPHHEADPHFGPQFLQLPPANVYIMRMENLNQEINKVFPLLGLNPKIKHKNRSSNGSWHNELTSVVSFNAIGQYYYEDFKRFFYE